MRRLKFRRIPWRCILHGHDWRPAIFPPGVEGCIRCPRRRGGASYDETPAPKVPGFGSHRPG